MSAWIQHIKAFAAKNNLSYGCALSNPECSRSYRASKEKKVGLIPEVKASRKVFADPNLMAMIEGFKPADELDIVLDTLTDKNQVSLLYYILKQINRFKIKGFMPSQTIVNFLLNSMYKVKLPGGKEVNVLGAQNIDIYNAMEDAVNKLFDTPELFFRINISKESIKAFYFWKGEKGAREQQEFYDNAYQTKIAPIMDSKSWVKRWDELDVVRQAKKAKAKK